MLGPILTGRCPPKCSRPWLVSYLLISLLNIVEGRQIFRSGSEASGSSNLRSSRIWLLRGTNAESSAGRFSNREILSIDRGGTRDDSFHNTTSIRTHPTCSASTPHYKISSWPFRSPFTREFRESLRPSGIIGDDVPCLCLPPPKWDNHPIWPDMVNGNPNKTQTVWVRLPDKLDKYSKPNPDAMPVCELFFSTLHSDHTACRSACLAAAEEMRWGTRYTNWLYQYWTYPTQAMVPHFQTAINGPFDYVASRLSNTNCAATCQSISNPYKEVACFIEASLCESFEIQGPTTTEAETTATTEETTATTTATMEETTATTTATMEETTATTTATMEETTATTTATTEGTTAEERSSITIGIESSTSEGVLGSPGKESIVAGNIIVGSVAVAGAICVAASCKCGCKQITGMRDFGQQLAGGADDLDRVVRHKMTTKEKLQNRVALQERLASRLSVALSMSQAPTTGGRSPRPDLNFTETSVSAPSTIFENDDQGSARVLISGPELKYQALGR